MTKAWGDEESVTTGYAKVSLVLNQGILLTLQLQPSLATTISNDLLMGPMNVTL